MDNKQAQEPLEEFPGQPIDPQKQQEPAEKPMAPRGLWWNGYRIAALCVFVPELLFTLFCISTFPRDPDGATAVLWLLCVPVYLLVAFLYIFAEWVYRHPRPQTPPTQVSPRRKEGGSQVNQQYQQPMQQPVQPQPGPQYPPQYAQQYPQGQFAPQLPQVPQYVVLQVTLKEQFIGTGSKNLMELQNVINQQAARGYRLHTISTASAHSSGFGGGDRIQATMVFERLF